MCVLKALLYFSELWIGSAFCVSMFYIQAELEFGIRLPVLGYDIIRENLLNFPHIISQCRPPRTLLKGIERPVISIKSTWWY